MTYRMHPIGAALSGGLLGLVPGGGQAGRGGGS